MRAKSEKMIFINYIWGRDHCGCPKAVQGETTCAPLWSSTGHSLSQGQICGWPFPVASGIKVPMSDDSIENLARKLAESVPEGLRAMRDDLETNFRGVLQTGISKLDLVTREEFEVQEAVLARTREKLERLEAKLDEIESNL